MNVSPDDCLDDHELRDTVSETQNANIFRGDMPRSPQKCVNTIALLVEKTLLPVALTTVENPACTVYYYLVDICNIFLETSSKKVRRHFVFFCLVLLPSPWQHKANWVSVLHMCIISALTGVKL